MAPGICKKHLINDPVREMNAAVVATVDLGAVRTNYRLAMRHFVDPDTKPSAVIKANGYGLDAGIFAQTLIQEGCRDFFVAHLEEALELRETLNQRMPELTDKTAVLLLEGLPGRLTDAGVLQLVNMQITPVLNSVKQIERWAKAGEGVGRPLPAILQVESGMHRSGLNPEELQELVATRPALLQQIDLQLVMSHLADAGNVKTAGDSFAGQAQVEAGDASEQQLDAFNSQCDEVRKVVPKIRKSLAASAGVFLPEEFHMDMIRLGGAFHGQAPFTAEGNPYAQVLTLTTTIGELKTLKKGQGVGYGFAFNADRDMMTATLPAGYADGLPRHKGGSVQDDGPYVLINGHKAPVVGKTSMDLLVVDVTGVPGELEEGWPVTLIGGPITPDHHGEMYGTNASETQVGLAKRVHKKYLDDENQPAPDKNLGSFIQSAW
jgi:alanine racemase